MISVVIPTHNRSDLIKRAVKSASNQTYKDIEIIVVSDGSTDNTKEVIEKFIHKDKRIKFIEYTPAKGGNVARNTGIAVAKGDYVAFLDDDDEWFMDKLEKQMAVFNNDPNIGLVYTGIRAIYVKEQVTYISRPVHSGDLSKKILLDNFIGTTSTVVLRAELLNSCGVFDNNLGAMQDYDLWTRICQKTMVGIVSDPMINYYNYPGNNQISQQTQKYEDAFTYLSEKYCDLYSKLGVNEKKIKKENVLLLLANKAKRNGSPKIARKYIVRALKNSVSFKSFIYFIISFFNYKIVLILRSKLK